MRRGMDLYIAAMEMDRGPMLQANKDRLMANDGQAYAAQQIANISWNFTDDEVRGMNVPAFVYSGTEDDYPLPDNHAMTKHSASLAPSATFFALEGYDHMEAFQDSANIIPPVRKFLADIER